MHWEDDSDSGDRGRPPEQEPGYQFGVRSMVESVTIFGAVGGVVLVVWGITWLTVGQGLGIVLVLLGLVTLAGMAWQFWSARKRRRPRAR